MKKFLCILACAALLSMSACTKQDDSSAQMIDGCEWITRQQDVDDNYMKIVEATEDIYSLYVSSAMSSEDFLTELEITQAQLIYVKNNYDTEKNKVIIDPQSPSVAIKGINALEDLFTDLNKLYLASVQPSGAPYSSIEVSYIYLNYKDKIIDDYIKYKAAVADINDASSSDDSSSDEREGE